MDLSEFNQLLSKHELLAAYFSTPDCNVCKVLKPQTEALINKFSDVFYTYIDSVVSRELCGQHLIFAVPTIIIFYHQREIKRFSRHFSLQELEQLLEQITSAD